ncbi:kinase-like protein [Eremomyces bilateralis CBS 781.70]|uniref:non-specific serine/threonine protein kinase n=1 Tax=Eremomyces bilateralis CBS 781.70 TaxID=1392243 RepID=A0A6G1FQ67_9PEZI|nr:kinase-like protein [Eremomyces bilateralis CBS 781.70]KAF1807937.1 kinase-like protein [Eremomyces bilateralis CBS 781.70]
MNGATTLPDGVPGAVLESKIEVQFIEGYTKHSTWHNFRQLQTQGTWVRHSKLGRGAFGSVSLETRRSGLTGNIGVQPVLRAVKKIKKVDHRGDGLNYWKELEAIAKFSQDQYQPFFVRSYGWYENNDSVFIAMEYFPYGDLRKYMQTNWGFPELEVRLIIKQMLSGIHFLHDEGFVHRDLKPENLLVEHMGPRWRIKIGDFGICKNTQATVLQTKIGTLFYMAPEVSLRMWTKPDTEPLDSYSSAVDIWAVGIIAVELLLKRYAFLSSPMVGNMQLNLTGEGEEPLSEPCRDFAGRLLALDPSSRLTARAAGDHEWIITSSLPLEEDYRFSIAETEPSVTDFTVSSASCRWSDLGSNSKASGSSTGTLPTTSQNSTIDPNLLAPNFRSLSLQTGKFFIIKSKNDENVEKSIERGVWTSYNRNNIKLNEAYLSATGPVLLFFSVVGSKKFCGVARMTSEVDWDNTDNHWVGGVWEGRFTLEWLSMKEVWFRRVNRVTVNANSNDLVLAARDGTEVSADAAYQMLRAFSENGTNQQR